MVLNFAPFGTDNTSTVPLGRGYFLMIPGSSCLATIVLSFRDKIHLTAEALLKLALIHNRPGLVGCENAWYKCAASKQHVGPGG
jgi:hypothetical protein